MPRLLYFLVCEKMLFDEGAPVPSFITVFDQLNVPRPPADVQNPNLGLKWVAVSYWRKIPDDEGKTFQQKTLVITPDGQEHASAIIEFTLSGVGHRNHVNVFGFPISTDGEYHVKIFIRDVTTEEWIEAGNYPIILNYIENE